MAPMPPDHDPSTGSRIRVGRRLEPLSSRGAAGVRAYRRATPAPALAGGRPPKQRWVYIVLCLFLGGLGVHNFYRGRVTAGFFQMFFGVLWIVSLMAGGLMVSAGLPKEIAQVLAVLWLVAPLGWILWILVDLFASRDAWGREML